MVASSSSDVDTLANMKSLTELILEGFLVGTNETLLPNTASDFSYHLRPASLQMGSMTRTDFVTWETNAAPILENFHPIFHSKSYDVDARRSVIHLSAIADTPLGKGTWDHEVIFICHFSEDGNTLLRIDEM